MHLAVVVVPSSRARPAVRSSETGPSSTLARGNFFVIGGDAYGLLRGLSRDFFGPAGGASVCTGAGTGTDVASALAGAGWIPIGARNTAPPPPPRRLDTGNAAKVDTEDVAGTGTGTGADAVGAGARAGAGAGAVD